MIDCATVKGSVEAYLAGRLSSADADALEDHAGSCERCAEFLEQRTRLPLALARELPPPAAVRAATLHRVGVHTRRRPRHVAGAAAIAASLLIVWSVTRPADKAAMMRSRETQSPLAMAQSRAFAEFEALEQARREIEAAIAEAGPDGRERLEQQRARLARQHDQLVALVQEFES
jgi:hypothetical protein